METRDVHALLGRTAYGADGDRLGTVTGAYLDNVTGRPSWITVERGGLFRTSRSFVPIDGAEVVDDGVRVAVDADTVKRAPHVEGDRVLTRAEELELRTHYGLTHEQAPVEDVPAPQDGALQQDVPVRQDEPVREDVEPGTGTGADEAVVVRLEEQARVGTTTVPASRAVLRRTRVVEDRTFSVPLGRDQVQVAYEPLPDTGPAPLAEQVPADSPQARLERAPGQAPAGGDADDADWVVLYEERLVVRTEWVPVERVRLRTVGVQGEEVVQVDLRRERIDLDVERNSPQEGAGRQSPESALPGPPSPPASPASAASPSA